MKKLWWLLALVGVSWAVSRLVDVKWVVSWQKAAYSKPAAAEQQCHLFVAGVYRANYAQSFEECRAKWLLEGYQLKPDSELSITLEI
ncbi:MAG TPA: hypothetical protein DCS87_11870 [Rheinheimera sp.]|nr:hypothetical protein [Rheinheimera sp.]